VASWEALSPASEGFSVGALGYSAR
jgi:hypothetical protein